MSGRDTVRDARSEDCEQIAAIYNEAIAEGRSTFETEPRSATEVAAWLDSPADSVLVAESERAVAGWARISPYSPRACYADVAEASVYVRASARGRGLGGALAATLRDRAQQQGLRKLVGKLFAENEQSRRLAARHGFREVGVHLRHGQVAERWHDVLVLELLLGASLPVDDGAADHLPGSEVPRVSLPSTLGDPLDLREAARGLLVIYVYPRAGRPGEPPPAGWDEIPGARGCTAQSCAFRDHVDDLAACGASVVGLSAQSPAEQLEFAKREHIPYPLLSDGDLRLADALGLPTFEVAGMRLYRRLTFIAREGRIEKVFYPVFPPERNAAEALAWIEKRFRSSTGHELEPGQALG